MADSIVLLDFCSLGGNIFAQHQNELSVQCQNEDIIQLEEKYFRGPVRRCYLSQGQTGENRPFLRQVCSSGQY